MYIQQASEVRVVSENSNHLNVSGLGTTCDYGLMDAFRIVLVSQFGSPSESVLHRIPQHADIEVIRIFGHYGFPLPPVRPRSSRPTSCASRDSASTCATLPPRHGSRSGLESRWTGGGSGGLLSRDGATQM